MKLTLTLLLALCGQALASPLTCPPVLQPDSQQVADGCGQGNHVYAKSGSSWGWYLEDIPGLGDKDWNDLVGTVTITGTTAQFTYLGSTAGNLDYLFVAGSQLFGNSYSHAGDIVAVTVTPDSEISLEFHSLGLDGMHVFTSGSQNVIVQCLTPDVCHPSTPVPEPSTFLQFGIAAAFLLSIRIKTWQTMTSPERK